MTPKPTAAGIAKAIHAMSICSYFPRDPDLVREIADLVARMVPNPRALDWLVDTMLNQVGEWRGPKELRGLLCTHFPPADGISAECTIAGFTPADAELRYTERHRIEAARMLQITGAVDPPMPERELEAFQNEILGPALKPWPKGIRRSGTSPSATAEMERQLREQMKDAPHLKPEQIQARKDEVAMHLGPQVLEK